MLICLAENFRVTERGREDQETKKEKQANKMKPPEMTHRPQSLVPKHQITQGQITFRHTLEENLTESFPFRIFSFHSWRMSRRISSLLPCLKNISHNSCVFKPSSSICEFRKVCTKFVFDKWPEHEMLSFR